LSIVFLQFARHLFDDAGRRQRAELSYTCLEMARDVRSTQAQPAPVKAKAQ
jgi:hypothetical protein